MEDLKEKEPENENEYLEMVKHLKQLYEEIEEKNKKLNKQNLDLQKVLLGAYGLSRVLDNMTVDIYDIPAELVILVETLRGFLSTELDQHIFNIKKIDPNELI